VQCNCGSGMQAVDVALRNIEAGGDDLVLAGGTEAMSRAPLTLETRATEWFAQWSDAESVADKLRKLAELRPGMLRPIATLRGALIDPACDLSMAQTADLAPASGERCGDVTAGNSSQISDGACWVLLASQTALERFRLQPLARLVDGHWAALDPRVMGGLGPVFAATPLRQQHDLDADGVDCWQINEAFAAQVLACLAAWDDEGFCADCLGIDTALGAIDPQRLNIDGGAIGLGHPVGTSGARIVLHLANALADRGWRRGIATECIGGGQGGATLIERVQ
jgi:acetyl-CoA acetyltransferase